MIRTGIVRRIDDLGRIVIPKEIRKSLRIKSGEPLEIEIKENDIVLKKFSSMSDLISNLNILINFVNKIITKDIYVFDRDKIVCVNGDVTNSYVNRQISEDLYNLMQCRKFDYVETGNIKIVKDSIINGNYIFNSVIPNGDVSGGVLIISDNKKIEEFDRKIAILINEFLTKYIEE